MHLDGRVQAALVAWVLQGWGEGVAVSLSLRLVSALPLFPTMPGVLFSSLEAQGSWQKLPKVT